jgi:2-haloacid dehalogenase
MNKKFLYTDVGDTLIKLRYSVSEMYAGVLEEHGVIKEVKNDEIQKHFKLAWREQSSNLPEDYVDRYSAHPEGHTGWWRNLIDSFLFRLAGTKINSDSIYEKIFAKFDDPNNWVVDPTFYDLLEFLKENQIGIGIISNWDLRLRALLTNMNLIQYFEHVIVSAEFGYEKPSSKIFEEAMRLTGINPENHFYVGDKLEYDYYPPEKMGWTSFWISKEDREGVKRVECLGDLMKFIL